LTATIELTCGHSCRKIERKKNMFRLRQLVAILCLVLLAWTFVAPDSISDLLFVLPLIAVLFIALKATEPLKTRALNRGRLDPCLFSFSLRAPPQL
jgi:hypothetical protein